MNFNKIIKKSAIILLLLVLISGCFFSSTINKYVVTNSATNSARVAKFGVNIEVTSGTGFLFETNEDQSSLIIKKNEKLIFAPGMKDHIEVTINGQSEVSVRVKAECIFTIKKGSISENYFKYIKNQEIESPIRFEFKEDNTQYSNIEELSNCNEYEPNTKIDKKLGITMTWPLAENENEIDTKLMDEIESFDYVLSISVEQID